MDNDVYGPVGFSSGLPRDVLCFMRYNGKLCIKFHYTQVGTNRFSLDYRHHQALSRSLKGSIRKDTIYELLEGNIQVLPIDGRLRLQRHHRHRRTVPHAFGVQISSVTRTYKNSPVQNQPLNSIEDAKRESQKQQSNPIISYSLRHTHIPKGK